MGGEKLIVGVLITSELHFGGGYQYEYMVLDILKKYHVNNEICLKYYTLNKKNLQDYSELDISIQVINENILQKAHRICLSNVFIYRILRKIGLKYSKVEAEFEQDNVDIVYFLSPSEIALGLSNIPFIFTLFDLGHLHNLEFPEVSYERRFEFKEILYTKCLKKAFKVIVDSNYGKSYAIKKYNLDEKRVEILKYLPNVRVINSEKNINIKEKYNVKNDYIFYPAQLWPHKNHIYILKAIKQLKEERNITIDVIFSGSNQGNLDYILSKAIDYSIGDLVHYIGFAPNEEIPYLYKQSLSLVMPTYFGPTNIPPLEAFAYGVAVCYSDFPFFREQVGDAVFFMDLNDPQDLVEHLITIKNDSDEVNRKISKGRKVLDSWNENDFYNVLGGIFNDYKYLRERWG